MGTGEGDFFPRLPIQRTPVISMQKSAVFPTLIVALALLFPVAGQSADRSVTSRGPVLLASTHKFAPEKNRLEEVRQEIIASSRPAPADSPVLLNRVADTKRKPARFVEISDSLFRKRLSARSAIILDAATGKEIYAHNPDRPGQPASTIKVLTSLIAIDYLKNSTLVPVSDRAAGMPRSKIYIRKGRSYYAEDLINAVMLASANDASVALAEKIGGSETGFARLMTKKAGELGAKKTVCKTASGLTAKGQQTTARDLAVIFNEAMKNQEFAERMKLRKAKTSYGKTLQSHNKALWQIDGTQGGKTGYTWAAKQTYVGKFSRNGEEILVAILGSRSMWRDIARLVEYGFSKKAQLQMAARQKTKPETTATPEPFKSALVVLSDSKKSEKL
jgi:D-alanyl-D-alanine carboxypeptidase (penicillin-binding protein 5/6)